MRGSRIVGATPRSIITAGLVGWWPFPEGSGTSSTKDMSVSGNDGNMVSMEDGDWIPGPIGLNALEFDGLEWIDLNGAIPAIGGLSVGSFCCWARMKTGASGTGRLFSITNSGSSQVNQCNMVIGTASLTGSFANESFLVYIADVSTVRLVCAVEEGEGHYADNTWHHFVVSINGTSNAIYVDGISKTVTYNTGSASSAYFTNITGATVSRIGGHRANTTDFGSSLTDIADARIYNRGITAAEALAIFKGRG